MIKTKKIKIDDWGNLRVNNKKKFCPFVINTRDSNEPCGIWCALFQEPLKFDRSIHIKLCKPNSTWTCEIKNFTDERIKEDGTS